MSGVIPHLLTHVFVACTYGYLWCVMRDRALVSLLMKEVELGIVMDFVKLYFPYTEWRKGHLTLESTREKPTVR